MVTVGDRHPGRKSVSAGAETEADGGVLADAAVEIIGVTEGGYASVTDEEVTPGPEVAESALRHRAIVAYANAHPDLDAGRVAARLVDTVGARALRAWAIGYVASVVEAYRRGRARRVEAEAELAALREQVERERRAREAERAAQEREAQAQRERERQARRSRSPEEKARDEAAEEAAKAERRAERQARRDAPFVAVRDQEEPWRAPVLFDRVVTPATFKQWMGDGFDAWLDGHRQALEAEAAAGDPVAPKWLAYFLHRFGLAPNPYLSPINLLIEEQLHEVAAQTRLEVTEELLGTVFALGDGRRVTWGDATVADHEKRIALLTAGAAGTLETAARHQAAVTLLEEAGVERLRDLPRRSAPRAPRP